jgi:hypothetical protein
MSIPSHIMVYGGLILAALVVCLLFGGVIKMILRLFFSSVRFLICLVLAAAVVGFFSYHFYQQPLLGRTQEPYAEQAVAAAAEEFSGFYSPQLPLLAWRISPADGADGASQPSLVKVQYLPLGSLIAEYDSQRQGFSIRQPLELPEKVWELIGITQETVTQLKPAIDHLLDNLMAPNSPEK